MQFSEFVSRLSKINNLPLPGKEAQFKMAPMERIKELKKADIEKQNPRQAGVMALFYPNKKGETYMILMLRRTYKGVHSNQVGFPGGKVEDEDENIEATALRETEEEIGVSRKRITVVRKLTNIYIPPSNFWVQSFIGTTSETPNFIPQEDEVEALIEVPLSELLSDEVLITQTLTTSYAVNITVPAFELQGHVVWGATAMMLSEVKELLVQVL
ncbi:CoA pyrophosphatase [Dokdonia sinensis]|uniref:CoA pyrophosphatase n=1 Tax=Dokdonia sinensis TaxID=2479847 RepID=A0A3M0GMQ7_9FLAO|nr:CoA pyrophosphatase [Dokdonia sinensis]RMB64012.1 CoA pyrophosphatase [Dokdonia sinensis]